MPGGGASVATYQKKEKAGGTLPFNGAFNGTSVDTATGKVQLGSNFEDPGPGTMTDYEEIDMAGFVLFFDLVSNSLDPSGRWPNFAISAGPAGFGAPYGPSMNISYTDFPVGTYGLAGWNFSAQEIETDMAWIRGINNDSFVFGDLFSEAFGSPAPRLIFFDSGNVTLNSQVGGYPTSNDIDTGSTLGIFGDFAVLDPADSGDFTQIGSNFIGNFINAPDFSSAGNVIYLNNQINGWSVAGENDPGLGGDYISMAFFGSPGPTGGGFLYMATATGDFIFWNKNSLTVPPTADSGDLMQLKGNLNLIEPGNALLIAEGANGRVGQIALNSGQQVIAIASVTSNSRGFVQLVTPTGASLTVQYAAFCSAGSLIIQANLAAGTINAADTSLVNYFVIN